MNDTPLVDPKEVIIEGSNGLKTKFILGKVPWFAGGRALCMEYVLTGIPKIGEFKRNEEIIKQSYNFIELVTKEGNHIRLVTDDIIHNHLHDGQTLMKLEAAMLEHNLGFSVAGKIFGFLDILKGIVGQSTTEILTALLERSSQQTKQINISSGPSTQ